MKILKGIVCSSACVLLTIASLACGSGNSTVGTSTPPVTAIAATSHPLVAQYSLSQLSAGSAAWVEFGTTTSYGRQTSVVPNADSGGELNILVAGMMPQTTYHMRAHVDSPGASWVDVDKTFTTAAIPTSLPLPQITATSPVPPSGGVEALSLVNGPSGSLGQMQGAVADLQGHVIWYCSGEAIPFKPMDNGHFMFMRGYGLEELDLLCGLVRGVTTDQMNASLLTHGYSFPPLDALHHDMLVLPNGHWIALGQVTENLVVDGAATDVAGDVLMDIDPNGEVVWAWSSFDHLDVNRHLYAMPDWTHSNAIVYTADGNLLLSMRGQSWILKIDYANGTGSGNILWKLGQEGDFTISSGDSGQWFYGQHNPSVVNVDGSQTTMAVYDDGNMRIDTGGVACGSSLSAPACYTRAAILQLDESTNVASPQWEYRPGFFSFWGGSIGILSNGNVEFDSSEPFNQFDSPAGDFNPQESEIIEVTQTSTPQVVWQMTITGANAYRGFRIPSLYPGVTWQQ